MSGSSPGIEGCQCLQDGEAGQPGRTLASSWMGAWWSGAHRDSVARSRAQLTHRAARGMLGPAGTPSLGARGPGLRPGRGTLGKAWRKADGSGQRAGVSKEGAQGGQGAQEWGALSAEHGCPAQAPSGQPCRLDWGQEHGGPSNEDSPKPPGGRDPSRARTLGGPQRQATGCLTPTTSGIRPPGHAEQLGPSGCLPSHCHPQPSDFSACRSLVAPSVWEEAPKELILPQPHLQAVLF